MERPDPWKTAAEFKRDGVRREFSWNHWIKVTGLRPGMDAKDWYSIFDAVTPAPPVPQIDFVPTHWLSLSYTSYPADPVPIMLIEQTDHYISYYREYNPGDIGKCADPLQYVRSLQPLGSRISDQDYYHAFREKYPSRDIIINGSVERVDGGAWVQVQVLITDDEARRRT